MTHYHGKLLLTGEYFVLDGAEALAVPTRLGQRFEVVNREYDGFTWVINYPDKRQRGLLFQEWNQSSGIPDPIRERLQQLFRAADDLNPGSPRRLRWQSIHCTLEFDPGWGLGSSSTLVAFLADFFEVDAYALLEKTFGGSGYDLACAKADGPLRYRRRDSRPPEVTPVAWSPEWLKHTYFVYLNQKQNSREGIKTYRSRPSDPTVITDINQLTRELLEPALHPRTAAQILERHEELVSKYIGLPKVKDRFPDFPGTVKSLGAWGGDFIWVLSEEPEEKVRSYFNERGYGTFFRYHDLAL